MNLHKTKDLEKLKSVNEASTDRNDVLDKYFAENDAIIQYLFAHQEGFNRTYRGFRSYPKVTDQYGRVLFSRIRIKVDVSPQAYTELRSIEEIGRCECVKPDPDTTTWFGDNPDCCYCRTCKKVFNAHLNEPGQ